MKLLRIEMGGFPCCNYVDRFFQKVPSTFHPFNLRMEGDTRVLSGVYDENNEETKDFALWSFLDNAKLPDGHFNYLTTIKMPDCYWHIFWSNM